MAARQIPPAGERVTASAIERAFERKVRLGKWALLFEQLWPRAWLVLGLAGLFIGASLAGLWPELPELPHKIVLGLFGLAFVAALVAAARALALARKAIRRVEAVSGIKHRPASSYEDTLTPVPATPAPRRSGASTASGSPRCCRSCASAIPRPHRPLRSLRPARAAAPRRLRAAGRGRRQRFGPAALGLPFRGARQGRGSAHRCLGDAAGLHRQAAHHAGGRRRTAWPGRRRRWPRPSRCRTAAS